MKYNIDDVVRYARGECAPGEAAAIRRYVAAHPELILRVLIEKRERARQKLNLTDELPQFADISNAVAVGPKRSLLDIFFKKSGSHRVTKPTRNSNTFESTTNPNTIMNNIEISKKTLEEVYGQAEEIIKGTDSSRSLHHNLMTALLARHPELTPDQAEKACSDIVKGVTSFHDTFAELCKTQPDDAQLYDTIYNRMMEELADKTPEQQATVMLNFIALVRTLDADNLRRVLADDDADAVDSFRAFLDEDVNLEGVEVTEEFLTELRSRLRYTIENCSLGVLGVEQANQLFDAAVDKNAAEEYLHSSLSSVDYAAYATLAAYIAALDNRLPGVEADVDPAMLGVSIAAGIEREKVGARTAAGFISRETGLRILKYIFGAFIIGVFALFMYQVMMFLIGFSVGFFGALLGPTSIVLICSSILGVFFGYKTIAWLVDKVFQPTLDKLSEGWDAMVGFLLSDNKIERIKKGFRVFVESFKALFNGQLRSPGVSPEITPEVG